MLLQLRQTHEPTMCTPTGTRIDGAQTQTPIKVYNIVTTTKRTQRALWLYRGPRVKMTQANRVVALNSALYQDREQPTSDTQKKTQELLIVTTCVCVCLLREL